MAKICRNVYSMSACLKYALRSLIYSFSFLNEHIFLKTLWHIMSWIQHMYGGLIKKNIYNI